MLLNGVIFIAIEVIGCRGKKLFVCCLLIFFCIFALRISTESPRVGVELVRYIYRKDVYVRLSFVFQNFATFDQSEEQIATGTSSRCVYSRIFSVVRKVCRVHIGVGFLCCSFLTGGHAKALKYGTGKGRIPTPFLYVYICDYVTMTSWGSW